MGWQDSTVKRIFRCDNQECACEILVVQNGSDDFLHICPFCNKESLYIVSGVSNISTFIGLNEPKTIGALAEKNTREKLRQGDPDLIKEIEDYKKKHYQPWWRKNKKINFDVLKNPKQYVSKGIV